MNNYTTDAMGRLQRAGRRSKSVVNDVFLVYYLDACGIVLEATRSYDEAVGKADPLRCSKRVGWAELAASAIDPLQHAEVRLMDEMQRKFAATTEA